MLLGETLVGSQDLLVAGFLFSTLLGLIGFSRNPMTDVIWFLLPFVLIGVYFLPTIVANYRKKKNYNAIMLVNIFLGWTFLGWVIALVWATMHDEEKK